MECYDNTLRNIYNFKNTAWNLEHNAEKLQEILNRIMQRINYLLSPSLKLVLTPLELTKYMAP